MHTYVPWIKGCKNCGVLDASPSGSSIRAFSMSMTASSSHSSLINSSSLKHPKQHQSWQKYFLNKKATLVRHMDTQNIKGPCKRLKTMPIYFKAGMSVSDIVWKTHHIPMTMRNLVKRSKLKKWKMWNSKIWRKYFVFVQYLLQFVLSLLTWKRQF